MSSEEQPKEMENKPKETTSNEPVEGSAVVAAAEDGALVSIAPTLYTGVSFIALALLVIGTTLPWLHRDFVDSGVSYSTDVTLWQTKTQGSDGTVVISMVVDEACEKYKSYMRTTEALAISAIVLGAVSLLVGLGARFAGKALRPLGVIVSVLTFATSLAAWAVAARVYYQSFCSAPSYRDQHFYISAGAGVFIAGWVLSFVGLLIAARDVRVPKVLPSEMVDRFVAVVFTILAFASLVFVVVATPISFMSKWVSSTTENRITMWHFYQYVNDNEVQKIAMRDINCGELSRYAKFAQSFAIISIGFALIAFLAGVLAIKGKFGKKGMLIFGFGAAASAFITLAAQLAIYYETFCTANKSFDEQKYHRDAGLALFAAAGSAMLFGFLFALVAALTQLLAAPAEGGNTRVSALLFIVGTVVSLVLMVVSVTSPVFESSNGNDYVRFNWWDRTSKIAGVFSQVDYNCQEIWQRMVGGGSLAIGAICLSAFGALLGIAQLTSASLRKPASCFTLLAAAAQLAAWALAMSVFQGNFCDITPYNSGYKYVAGFGLMVAAFCVNTLVSVFNLLVAPA